MTTEVLPEDHWNPVASTITGPCREAVADHPAVRSVAHYSHGALDFVVRPRDSAPLPARTAHGDLHADEGRPGRHLVVCAQDLDRSLGRLGTGELMRLLVGTPAGGMYCGRIRSNQHLTGLTLTGAGVPEMDRALNEAVRVIRSEVHGLPNENLGGALGLGLEKLRGDGMPYFEVSIRDRESAEGARLRELWPRFVSETDLQYAAFYRDGALVCAGDALDHPRLVVRLSDMPGAARRALYRDLAGRLRSDVTRLRDAMRPVVTGPVDRLVLDVQEGAVFIHWTGHGPGTFLLGVTTDQYRVDQAENRLRALLRATEAARGAG